jgi:hypothetical protein
VPAFFPILTRVALPEPILSVVTVPANKLNVVAVEVISPPLTAKSESVPSAPEIKVSPPKIIVGTSRPVDDLFPETKNFTPAAIDGNLELGSSAIISDPDIAVIEDPLLPDTVPTSAISLYLSEYLSSFLQAVYISGRLDKVSASLDCVA